MTANADERILYLDKLASDAALKVLKYDGKLLRIQRIYRTILAALIQAERFGAGRRVDD